MGLFCSKIPKEVEVDKTKTTKTSTTNTTTNNTTTNNTKRDEETEEQTSCCSSVYTFKNKMKDKVFFSSCCNSVNVKD